MLNPNEVHDLRSVTASRVNLGKVGRDIYEALRAPKRRREIFQSLVADKFYSPTEVAEIMSVSYNSALRLMESTSKTVDLAKPRTRKRLLRIRGKHLREYLEGKA